jgi:gliding motility-associated-like protein
MVKSIKSLFVLIFLLHHTVSGQNCPNYSNTAAGSGAACGGQNYVMTVPNTGCNGEIFFQVVGNYGSSFANEITWQVVSSQSGAVVASGGPGTNGANINVNVGPLNPNIHGSVYDLIVYDSWGDGFNGTGGFIQAQQGGTVLANINGNFGAEAHMLFNVNIVISAATITINTPSGNVVETVNNCNNFIVQVPLSNANYCNTINVNLPWTITCDVSGATLASGNHSVTVYPQVPSAANDLVEITWNTTTCYWDIEAQNDCDALDIGTIFTITPDPSGLPIDACSNASQNFTIDYVGLAGSPDCCATAGPQIPITYTDTQTSNDAVAQNSTFGGQNNSAFIDFPPNNTGGNATSLELCYDMTNFCFNPPGTSTDQTYYVFVFIDGNQVHMAGPLTGPSHSFCIDLTDIPGGYTQSSNIEIYTLPNTFNTNAPVIYTNFNPNANCGSLADGIWTADFNVTLDVTFSQTIGSPVDCSFDITENQSCCSNTNLTASNPPTTTVDCSDDVPPADPAIVDDATSDCSSAPTVTFVSEVSNNNVCNGEQLTRTYEVEDACGNTIQVTHTIVIDSYIPTFTLAGADPSGCGINDGTITFSGLDPSTSYEIGYNGNPTQTVTTDANGDYVISGLAAGSYTDFSITASSCTLCEATDATVIDLVAPNPPTVNAGDDIVVCEGTTITLTGSGTATSYTWDNGVTDGVGFIQPVGTVTYTVTGIGANGCQNTDQIDVTIQSAPTVNAGADITECEGTTITLTASGTATSYTWDNGVIDGVGFIQPIGTVTYTVTGSLGANCSTADQISVTINANPTVDAGEDQIICIGEAVTLDAFAGLGSDADFYVWDNSITNGVSFTPNSTTTYTVIGENTSTGCNASDDVTITVNALPNINAGADIVECEGTAITLTGSGNATSYTWNNAINDGEAFNQPVGTVTYNVSGTDANGCQNTDQVDVTVIESPNASVTASPTSGYLPLDVTFTNNSTGGNSYDWDFGNGSSSNETVTTITETYDEAGTYIVTLTVVNGNCTDQVNVTIIVDPFAPLSYNIPNVFTPNNDGSNDIFHFNLQFAAEVEATIFNRWGNTVGKITEVENDKGWNGQDFKNGQDLPEGVYFFNYRIKDLNGEEVTGQGHVTLLRK